MLISQRTEEKKIMQFKPWNFTKWFWRRILQTLHLGIWEIYFHDMQLLSVCCYTNLNTTGLQLWITYCFWNGSWEVQSHFITTEKFICRAIRIKSTYFFVMKIALLWGISLHCKFMELHYVYCCHQNMKRNINLFKFNFARILISLLIIRGIYRFFSS